MGGADHGLGATVRAVAVEQFACPFEAAEARVLVACECVTLCFPLGRESADAGWKSAALSCGQG
ncbi:hypothetical protein SF23_02040 [Streptomyces sp. MBRL 10]|nr:hypothetical protein SF23_02040 [Streptomyces sp. MBRL 10]